MSIAVKEDQGVVVDSKSSIRASCLTLKATISVADFVAEFLAHLGIKHVFVVTGGAAARLIDSIARRQDIQYVCSQHEQAAAMAVDAYTRVTRNMGAAIVTTGPGVTNLLTGMCCLYYDSLPSIFIGGEVSTFRLSKNAPGVRQLGFQEAPHLDLVRPITKYAVLVEDPTRIRYELEKAVYLATSGRPGPVFVDIPDNVQRMEIEPGVLEAFVPDTESKDLRCLEEQIDCCLELIQQTKRPVLVLGAAVKIAKVEAMAKAFAERLRFPVALTWATMDLFPGDHPLHTGGFGISSTRRGNFAIQNADLVFSVGSRLDSHATGSPVTGFARGAKKIIVDVDRNELSKFGSQGMAVDLLIQADVRDFFAVMQTKTEKIATQDLSEWHDRIHEWRRRFPVCMPSFHDQQDRVNPYVFLECLSAEAPENATIVVDCGANLIQTFQGFSVKGRQMLFSAFNASPMGYSLAGSIGAWFAGPSRPVLCLIGDGGLQVNIQELATIARHKMPIKIFLFNNHGYGIIKQTQDDWYDARYEASTPESGLADPDYIAIAKAYGLAALNVPNHSGLREKIRQVLQFDGPVLCNLDFSPDQRIIPMVKYGRPIEDPWPYLDRMEFLDNMLIPPLEASIKSSH